MSTNRAVPILNLPNGYLNGLASTNGDSNNLISIQPGQCRDASNSYDIVSENELILDINVAGLNGVDLLPATGSSWYYIYLILDPTGKNPKIQLQVAALERFRSDG